MATVRINSGAVTVLLAAALGVGLTASSLVACGGSSDDASLFQGGGDAAAEATPIPTYDAGTLVGDPEADASTVAPTCTPTKGAFTAQYVPPAPFKQAACSDAQIDAFYTACLASPIDAATCTAFVGANGACSSCLQSQETDATYGPVIWHASNKYYTTNVAGCIANAEHDTTTTGCAASYQAILQCNETACEACFAGANGSFANFVSCQQAAIKDVCLTYADDERVKCNTVLHPDAGAGDGGPTTATECVPPKGASGKDAYKQLAPLFCGK